MLTPKKHLTKREIKEDKLVTAWFKFSDFLSQHSREILLGLGGVVVVGALIFLFNWMKNDEERQASEQFAKARGEYNNANFTGAIPALEKVVNDFGGTKTGSLATVYLANAYMQTKDYVNAEKYYKKYLDDGDDDPILAISAASGGAATYEERGDKAKAAKLYEDAASDYSGSYRAPQLLLNAARCYKQAGQAEGARRTLQKLIDKYPKSTLLEEAKQLLAETGQVNS